MVKTFLAIVAFGLTISRTHFCTENGRIWKRREKPKGQRREARVLMATESQEATPKSSSKTSRGYVDMYAAQCVKCLKWRVIPTLEEYESIRSRLTEEPFSCSRAPAASCDDPADIEYDATRTWVIDRPNIPKSPAGFKRNVQLRRDFSKFDAYYIAPNRKKLKSRPEVGSFLEANPGIKDLSVLDFNFSVPKIMEETLPDFVASGKRSKTSVNNV